MFFVSLEKAVGLGITRCRGRHRGLGAGVAAAEGRDR